MSISTIDIVVVIAYAVSLWAIAQWVSRQRDHRRTASDYFLAGKSLPWWAIGTSLIAANISAEQIIGMSGSGFAIGLGIASYEWMAALTLILVGKYFMPIFLKQRIYTMPQFLERRYDHRVRIVMAVFWLGVYVFVNLTSVLWLGALAMNTVTGLDMTLSLWLLGGFALAYSLYGGLKAVALTDVLQVTLLVLGGLIIAWITLDRIADGAGAIAGFGQLLNAVPEKFDLILSRDNPHYVSLPGISVLIGGLWIMNLSYWGFNQYIIQRTLAAKSLAEAQKGIAFAAYLKLLMPVIVVLPGLTIAVLQPGLDAPDQAYPTAMSMLPVGIKGLVFAALVAAIVSSLASMSNSISTIFTMDLYRGRSTGDDDTSLVGVGRLVSVAAMVVAALTARPLLGNFDQAFQYIQEFTGFFTPGIVVIFVLGMFWRRTTTMGALTAAIASAVLSLTSKLLWPNYPFLDRVGWVFVACTALAVVVSLAQRQDRQAGSIDLRTVDFGTSSSFNWAAVGVVIILAALYTTWW